MEVKYMGIGTRLQEIIVASGKNVNQIATATNISPNTIYSIIKRDNTKVDIDILIKICRFLGVTVEDIISDVNMVNTQPVLNSHEINLITAYRENPDMQPAVDRLLLLEKPAKSVIFRAAKSSDNHPPEILETTKDFSKIPPTDIKL